MVIYSIIGRIDSFKQLIIITESPMKNRSPSKTPCYIGEDKLKIIIRIRPILNEEDYEQFVQLEDDNTLQIKRPGICTYMKFNNILPPTSTQKDLFHLVEDSIKEFLNGINMTIFAYGQTGAGKTYSMIGNYSPKDSQQNLFNFLSSKQRGILSRSLEMIMSFIHKSKGNRVFVSFFQIYNEKIFDLYNNNMVSLDIREAKNGEISIPDLMSIEVFSMEEAIEFLMAGLKNRATGSTHGNAQSSRSHSIFHINLQRQNQRGETTYSSLRIVDLAGSQKFKIPSDLSPSEKQVRIQQLTSINGSLSCLGHCISALIQKSRTHIPFRNSKLTRILSDSLLGQGKMRFIICISPSFSAHAETFSTLQFANRAKKAIFQRAQIRTPNLSKKKSSQNQQITVLKKQLERQKQIRSHLEGQLKNILVQRPQGIVKQNTYLRKQNQKLKQQLKQMMVKKDSNGSNNHNNILNKKVGNILGNCNRQLDLSPQRIYGGDWDKDKGKERDGMTGEDLKLEMLKLPIFQNKKSLDLLESKFEQRSSNADGKNCLGDGPKLKQIKQNAVPYNRKKAEFQKKIRKFIQSDSPSQQQQQGGLLTPNTYKNSIDSKQKKLEPEPAAIHRTSPSFINPCIFPQNSKKNRATPQQHNKSHSSSIWNQKQQHNNFDDHFQSSQIQRQNQYYQFQPELQSNTRFNNNNHNTNNNNNNNHNNINMVTNMNMNSYDNNSLSNEHQHQHLYQHQNQQQNNNNEQEWIQNQDTQQLIEQACEKMNLPDFKDLKSEMDRAKQQLILLKKKDDEISRRKQVDIKY